MFITKVQYILLIISLRPVIVILSIEVVISGEEIGQQLGNPVIFEPRAKNPEPSNQVLERNNHDLQSNNHDFQSNNNSDHDLNHQSGAAGTKMFFMFSNFSYFILISESNLSFNYYIQKYQFNLQCRKIPS